MATDESDSFQNHWGTDTSAIWGKTLTNMKERGASLDYCMMKIWNKWVWASLFNDENDTILKLIKSFSHWEICWDDWAQNFLSSSRVKQTLFSHSATF